MKVTHSVKRPANPHNYLLLRSEVVKQTTHIPLLQQLNHIKPDICLLEGNVPPQEEGIRTFLEDLYWTYRHEYRPRILAIHGTHITMK